MGKTIAKNKRAYRNYDFEEFYEAGIVLDGTEVKALRDGRGHLKEAYAMNRGGEIYLVGAHIGPYSNAPENQQHETDRPRKLLLKRREINTLIGKISREGYSLVPTQMYFNKRGLVKVQVGLGKGLKKHDKREKIKEREEKRRLRQKYKTQIR
ncbi:MAG: SsrA-binding protein SmpB [bacterium]